MFLSHASGDGPVAKYLKACFARALGVDVFMMPDDAPPGSEWIEVIREGVRSCDELFSLATPSSVRRPWMSAEWACFWLQEKPCTPLLVDVTVADLWEPMRAYQAVDLIQPTRCMPLLQRLALETGVQPPDGVLAMAHEMAEEIPKIRERIERDSIEDVVTRVSSHIRSGAENIDPDDVALMVREGRLPDLLDIAESADAAVVKVRQTAVALVRLGRLGEALRLALGIPNRAETTRFSA